ncbi:hypothetical protein, partial [Staphylococcus capitis]|uniref:hypothetical protein n=1 Tax=Staphylococcus capitis TaxID=29388 RepID=UPI00066C8B24
MINTDALIRHDNELCRVIGVSKTGAEVICGYDSARFVRHEEYEVVEDIRGMYEQQKQRADELQDIIERFLYANRESDVYAICSEKELLSEY